MSREHKWSRRQFSQAALAASAGAAVMGSRAFAMRAVEPRGFAFVGRGTDVPDGGTLEVFQVHGSDWRHSQSVPAVSPAHLLVHTTLPVLYAVHDVPLWRHLPRGAVSAYAFDRQTGHLSLMGTQPLSLSATHPRHATLTAGASHLFVAAEDGGIYNALPIAADGSLLPVSAIRKEFGWDDGDGDARLASPRAVALLPDGSLLAADAGQERLTRLRVDARGIAVLGQMRAQAGQGPSQLSLGNGGTHAYALNTAGDALCVHALTGSDVQQGSPAPQMHALANAAKSMQVAPGGRYLVTAARDVTEILRIHPADGSLANHSRLRGTGDTALCFSPGGGQMIGLDAALGNIYATAFDPVHGLAGRTEAVAHAMNGVSMIRVEAGRTRTRLV